MRPAASFKRPWRPRDDHDTDRLDAAQVAAEAERLGAAVDRLVAGRTVYAPNRRLLDHLARERGALFTFLGPARALAQPEVQATNRRAEHAIRPAVVCRTAWGGNRSWPGAQTWQVLSSMLATAHLQQRDPVALLVSLLRAPGPVLADLASPAPRAWLASGGGADPGGAVDLARACAVAPPGRPIGRPYRGVARWHGPPHVSQKSNSTV